MHAFQTTIRNECNTCTPLAGAVFFLKKNLVQNLNLTRTTSELKAIYQNIKLVPLNVNSSSLFHVMEVVRFIALQRNSMYSFRKLRTQMPNFFSKLDVSKVQNALTYNNKLII